MSNCAGTGPCRYKPYADSIGSMPLPKHALDYGAYGVQDVPQASGYRALLRQSSKWELEQELCDNYLGKESFDHAQTAVPEKSDLHRISHPSITAVTSGFYDKNVSDSSSDHAASFASSQVIAGTPPSDYSNATQFHAQFHADVYTISPSVLESPRQRERPQRGSSPHASNVPYTHYPGPQQYALLTYKRRNVQVPDEVAAGSLKPAAIRTNPWRCPYCPYEQYNRRSPELKRHVATHNSEEATPWVCCGVPVFDAHVHGVPENVVHEEAFQFGGVLMVGGCKKTFSRRDLLSHHLRREEGRCFGDAFAIYQPGNRVGLKPGL
ncbi:hypothetical protein C8Q74DRAFT_1441177 [Fomes fomentarius]|nr:hypothetical protein C8Q74DRAFT_1441177 [Fomes fomentarius]